MRERENQSQNHVFEYGITKTKTFQASCYTRDPSQGYDMMKKTLFLHKQVQNVGT